MTEAPRLLESAVVLQSVTKVYGRGGGAVTALRDVSVAFARGTFTAVMGASGSGKSTLMHCAAGLDRPTKGSVLLGDVDLSTLKETALTKLRRERVGFVFQAFNLLPALTVMQNITLPLRLAGAPIDRHWAQQVLTGVGLTDKARRRPAQLSGGQQQRVALARAIVIRPRILLCDEPLAALDRKLRQSMQFELKSLQQQLGVTTIFVTHDQEEAMTISDRIAVMNNGKIEQLGPPEEVYERPATEFVAEFLGASNLLDGVYRGTQDGLGLVELASGAKILIQDSANRHTGEPVRVGVRPEKIHILAAGAQPSHGQNVVAATLRSAVFAGVSFQYFFQTSEGKEMTAFDRNSTGGAVAKPGDPEILGFAAAGPATDEDLWPRTDGELYELHVLPSAAGEGHDQRLLNAVADTFAEDGFSTGYTWVLSGDEARLDFLKAAGWAPDGSRSNLDMGVKVAVERLHTRAGSAGG